MRVVDRSEGRVFGRTPHGKFIEVGFSDNDCAGFFQPPDRRRSVRREIVFQDARSTGCPYALGAEVVFNGNWNAGEGLPPDFVSDGSVHSYSPFDCALTVDREVSIETVVIIFDTIERCTNDLTRLCFAEKIQSM